MAGAYPRAVRRIAGILAGAAVAALGAVVLGEYPFSGWLIRASGVLLGLFVAEAVVAVGGEHGRAPLPAAVLAGAGLTWAAWISEGHEISRLGATGWVAIAVGMIAAGARARSWGATAGSRPGAIAGSQPGAPPPTS
jgi:hypothetical protein